MSDVTGGPPSAARVGIVGLGLIGGSLARTLAAGGVPVRGWDADPVTRVRAEAAGLTVAGSLEDLCAWEPTLVVLAVPLRAVAVTARSLAASLVGSPVVTDVGSVKTAVRAAIEDAGLGGRYVGAHPMAGTEHSGFGASDAQLLVGAHWGVTLDDATDADAFLVVAELVTTVLDGVVLPVTDAVHDEAVALISHVPHVVATELLNQVAVSSVRAVAEQLAAGSFRDGTRVARTDPRRTEAMVVDNTHAVVPALRAAARHLEQLASSLEAGDPVDEYFDLADPLRERTASGQGDGTTAEHVLVLEDDWRRTLAALGERGGRVTSVDAPSRSVRMDLPVR